MHKHTQTHKAMQQREEEVCCEELLRSHKQNQTCTDQSFCLKRKIQLCPHHIRANWAAIIKWPLTAVFSIRRHAAKAKTWAALTDILTVSRRFPLKLYLLENIQLNPEVIFCSVCASRLAFDGWFCYLKKLWSGEVGFFAFTFPTLVVTAATDFWHLNLWLPEIVSWWFVARKTFCHCRNWFSYC